MGPEWEKPQRQGFDFGYDKRLYDHLEHDDAEVVWQHLLADIAYQAYAKYLAKLRNYPQSLKSCSYDLGIVSALDCPEKRLGDHYKQAPSMMVLIC